MSVDRWTLETFVISASGDEGLLSPMSLDEDLIEAVSDDWIL